MINSLHTSPEPISARGKWDRADWWYVSALILLVTVVAAKILRLNHFPFEDAAMLMRYSQHLAQGYGIVYNVGDRPVDGATDFLFMIVLAGLVRIGLPLEASVQVVGFASHLVTVIVVYGAVRGPIGGGRWLALGSAIFMACGPGLDFVALFFGTPFFAMFAALAWYYAMVLVQPGESAYRRNSLGFAVASLLMGLTRPEGVLLAFFMLAGVYFFGKISQPLRRQVLIHFFFTFAVLGGGYFVWRWYYFGYPLPNPFYKKSGGHLHMDVLRDSIYNVYRLAGAYVLVYLIGIWTAEGRRRLALSLFPICGFTMIWLLLSNEMNWLGRFQYAIYPVVVISGAYIIVAGWVGLHHILRAIPVQRTWALVAAAVLVTTAWQARKSIGFYRETKMDISIPLPNLTVARMLAPYQTRGYTMATSEAGTLPLYSGWHAIDTWGLNDSWIAHHGQINAAYLDRTHPEMIIFHAPYLLGTYPNFSASQDWFGLGPPWYEMVVCLVDYSRANGYRLCAVFQDANHTSAYYYYVRKDFADSNRITASLQSYAAAWKPSS